MLLLTIDCDFEDQRLCNYTIGLDSPDGIILPNLGFYPQIGSTPSTNTGPSVDATLGTAAGQYMYAEATSLEQGKNAWMVSSPFYSEASGNCPTSTCSVTFAYHMYGSGFSFATVATEVVFANATALVLEDYSGISSLDSWRTATVHIPPVDGPLRLRWRFARGGSTFADFAVDDVEFSSGCLRGESMRKYER